MILLGRKLHSAFHIAQVQIRDPRYRRALNRVVAVTRPRGLPASSDARELAAQLDRDGFVRLGKPFDVTALNHLKDALLDLPCMDPWHPEWGQFSLEDTPAGTNNARLVGIENIAEALHLANDPRILSIVSRYLGCRPTIDNMLAWWSIADRPAPIEEQLFHRDNPSIKFVKMFVYLTDVTEAGGPHVFVRASHRSSKLLAPSRRFADGDVVAAVGDDMIVRFTGEFGTVFLEDTFGLHKGEVPSGSNRLIFQVTYSTLPAPSAAAEMGKTDIWGHDPYVNRLLKTSSKACDLAR